MISSVVINGGGISGAILALMLSTLNKKSVLDINLIEFFPPDSSCFFHDSRCIALSLSTYRKLMSFSSVSPILSSCSTAIKRIEVSNTLQNPVVFSATDYHISSLGYVIELRKVKKKIFDLLYKLSSVKLFCPAKLKQVEQTQYENKIILDDGNKIFSQLLIAADGSYSSLATLCGMEWDFFDYSQIAVVANITTSFPNEGCAFELFTTYGSLALLPLSYNMSSLIWCIPISYKEEVLSWSVSEFCGVLQKIFGWRLGYILHADERHFFSLFLRKSKSHVSHRLALVGNAAQTIHPIAAQGFNLGFRDILSISEIISKVNTNGFDIGNYTILNLYRKSRELDQFKVISMTHGMALLFNNNLYYPFIFSRDLFLTVLKYSSLLRSLIVKPILGW